MRTLTRRMGIETLYRKPDLSKPAPEHKTYPYLLRGIEVTRPNRVWATDITYIPMARGFLYLAAVVDWFSRRVLSWRLSVTMDVSFCLDALEEAIEKHVRPEIFNTDQGRWFTIQAFTGRLKEEGIRISMDGKGRWADNVFVERPWRSLKYEHVYLHAYQSVAEARADLDRCFTFYINRRPHSSLGPRRQTRYTSTARPRHGRPGAPSDRPWKCRSVGKRGSKKAVSRSFHRP